MSIKNLAYNASNEDSLSLISSWSASLKELADIEAKKIDVPIKSQSTAK